MHNLPDPEHRQKPAPCNLRRMLIHRGWRIDLKFIAPSQPHWCENTEKTLPTCRDSWPTSFSQYASRKVQGTIPLSHGHKHQICIRTHKGRFLPFYEYLPNTWWRLKIHARRNERENAGLRISSPIDWEWIYTVNNYLEKTTFFFYLSPSHRSILKALS